jgi:hypothetical protein
MSGGDMPVETKFNLGDRVFRKREPGYGYDWMKGHIDEMRIIVALPPFKKHEVMCHIKCDDAKKASGFHCTYPEEELELLTEQPSMDSVKP